MHRLLLTAFLLLPALVLPACGAGSGPVGVWELDSAATADPIQAKLDEQLAQMPEDQRAMAKTMMDGMVKMLRSMTVTMTVNADGTFAADANDASGDPSRTTGTWKLEGDKITMTGKEEGKDEEETLNGTVKGDSIVITMAQGDQSFDMVFKRKG